VVEEIARRRVTPKLRMAYIRKARGGHRALMGTPRMKEMG